MTALGRLMQSGPLRDAFTADPAGVARDVGVREGDLAAFLQLVPGELEFQAGALLRKRLDLVRRALPRTCQALGREAWEEFRRYGRIIWPAEKMRTVEDAFGFCQHLLRVRPAALCRIEFHRVRFARGRNRWEIRFVRAVSFQAGFRPGVQVFLRRGSNRWHEWLVFPGV